MYAVVKTGGQQYRVAAGDTIIVKRLDAEVGAELSLDVLMLGGGEDAPRVGAPLVDGARVLAEVVSHDKGEKRDIFKYRRRHRTRRHTGFRPSETTITIKAIEA